MNTTKYKLLGNTLLLLTFLWLIFLCIQFLKKEDNQTLENYLPTNSEIVLKVKSKSVIKRFLSDILYKNNFDRKSISKFEIDPKNATKRNLGIDLEKNVLFFYEKWQNKDILGVFVHINNEENFIGLADNQSTFTSVNGKVGCLLNVVSNHNGSTASLEKYCIDLLKQNRDKSFAKLNLQKLDKQDGMIDLYIAGNQNSLLNNLLLQLTIDINTIQVKGMATQNPALETDSLPRYFMRTQDKKHLALNMGKLPDTLNYYLNRVLKEIHLNVPKIKNQHILFYGLGLDNIGGKMAVQPYFDAIFRFEDTLTISNKMAGVVELDSSIATISKDTVSLGNTRYFFKQLSRQDIYVGIHPQPKIYTLPSAPFFYLRGRPEALLSIDGDSWIADIARAIPQVRNSKAFLEEIETFELEAYGSTNLNVDVRGKIEFKTEELATLKCIEYFLSFIKAPTLKEN